MENIFTRDMEDANFASAVGIDRIRVSRALQLPIYLQGEFVPDTWSPFISIYSGFNNFDYIKSFYASGGSIGKRVELPERFREYFVEEPARLDLSTELRNLPTVYAESVHTLIEVNDGEEMKPVAFATRRGDIYFCDFIHDADIHYDDYLRDNILGFFEWALQTLGVISSPIELWKSCLDFSSFTVRRLKEIVVEDTFDKKLFEKEVMQKAEVLARMRTSELESRNKLLENEVALLRDDLKNFKREATVEVIRVLNNLQEGWKLTTHLGMPALTYSKKIVMDRVMLNGHVYEVGSSRYYVKNLIVTGLDNISRVWALTSRHPNVNGTELCVGDLRGKPTLENLDSLIELCKCGSVDDPYNTTISRELKDLISAGSLEMVSSVFNNEEMFEA